VIIDGNPLENLQLFYGTGAIKLTTGNKIIRAGGIKYTIKDGIVYDAKELLNDVKKMVDDEKKKNGWKLIQPGILYEN
jgi:hypothetical protein